MNEIWPKVRLGDVCEFRRGLTYSKGDEVEVSSNVVLRSNNVDLDTGLMVYDELKYISNDFEIPDDKRVVVDSVLMCMANGSKAHLGKVGYIEKDLGYAFGGFMGLLVPKGVDGKYLYWVLSSASFKKLIQGLTAGANINNLRFAAIKEFEIPLPPLAEQKKIVEKVEKALKRVEALKAQFERMEKSAADYFKAALAETFAAVKGEKVKLGDVCEFMNGDRGSNYPAKSKLSCKGEIPFISALNLENRTVVTDRLMYLSQQQYDALRAGKLKKGDIALCIRGSLGKFCIYPFEQGAIASSLVILRCGLKIDANFLANYLESAEFYRQVGRDDHGTAQPNLAAKSVMMFDINLPVLSEQKCVVHKLDAAKSKSERMVAAARRGIEICGKMRKAILAEAFQ